MNSYKKKLIELNQTPLQDSDEWVGQFYPLLQEIIKNSDSVEESVLAYFATQLIENQVSNGGFAQAFINLGPDSEWFEYAINGYIFFNKPMAATVIKEALTIAKEQSEAIKSAKNGSIQLTSDYFKKGEFKKISTEYENHIIPWTERAELVKKHFKDFSDL